MWLFQLLRDFRFSQYKLLLIALIILQICLIGSYFLIFSCKPEIVENFNKIVFVQRIEEVKSYNQMYFTLKDNVTIKTSTPTNYFLDFNSTLCFKEGIDIKMMLEGAKVNWKCICLVGWHGPDCGTPEVLLRGLLAKRKPVLLRGPRRVNRKLIYLLKYDKSIENLVDIRISSLGDLVDLFIIYEDNNTVFEKLLKQNFFKQWQEKIFYIPNSTYTNVWKIAKPHLNNLQENDYVLYTPSNEIIDRSSLMFLKFYENIPEFIRFRLKWSVFGFFWIHPKKTVMSGGLCSVSFLRNNLNDDVTALNHLDKDAIVLGDLNHTGGWFCEYCSEPLDIVEYMRDNDKIDWSKIGTTKVTYKFIVKLIEAGVYIDGRTELLRGYRYSDIDFAPKHVLENDFKFDFLVVNFHSQNEYYLY